MNTSDLTLNQQHYAKVQEALKLVSDLIRVERRQAPVYVSLRADLRDAADNLRRVLALYQIMISGQGESPERDEQEKPIGL